MNWMLPALTIIAILLGVGCLKWRISTLTLIYYLKKSGYKEPSDSETKECSQFVIRNLVKDLFRTEP